MYRYRSISMGFGVEGVNGLATRLSVVERTLSWLLDPSAVDLRVAHNRPLR